MNIVESARKTGPGFITRSKKNRTVLTLENTTQESQTVQVSFSGTLPTSIAVPAGEKYTLSTLKWFTLETPPGIEAVSLETQNRRLRLDLGVKWPVLLTPEDLLYLRRLPQIKSGVPWDGWIVDTISDFSSAFQDWQNAPIDITNWNIRTGKDFSGMFMNSNFNQSLNLGSKFIFRVKSMFKNAKVFNSEITTPNGFMYVKDFSEMFSGAEGFNKQVTFNLVNAVTVADMFYGAKAFNQPVNFSGSRIQDFSRVFSGAKAFNQPVDIDWSRAKNVQEAFKNAESFNQPVNGKTFTPALIQGLYKFLENCKNFNQPVNDWNVSGIPRLEGCFNGAAVFNQSLESWDVSDVNNIFKVLNNTALDAENATRTLIGWANTWKATIEQRGVIPIMNNDAVTFNPPTIKNPLYEPIGLQPAKTPETGIKLKDLQDFFLENNIDIVYSPTKDWANISGFYRITQNDIDNRQISITVSGANEIWIKFPETNTFTKGVKINERFVFNIPILQTPLVSGDILEMEISCISETEVLEIIPEFVDFRLWDVSNLVNANGLFIDNTDFNSNIGHWSIRHSRIQIQDIFTRSGISPENLARTLIGWANQTVNTDFKFMPVGQNPQKLNTDSTSPLSVKSGNYTDVYKTETGVLENLDDALNALSLAGLDLENIQIN